MLRYRGAMPLVLVQRDSGEGGSVRAARDGSLIIKYTPTQHDKDSLMKGLQGSAEILVAAGAVEVGTSHINDTGFKPAQGSLKEYLESIERRGMKDHEIGLFSAHQMGSCRMATSPSQGAVDPNGELWECDDLYVMDASVFPTASGSNPMVTVASISYMLSQRLCSLLNLRDDGGRKRTTISDFAAGHCAKAVDFAEKRREMRSRDYGSLDGRPSLRNSAAVVVLPVLSALLVARLLGRWWQ